MSNKKELVIRTDKKTEKKTAYVSSGVPNNELIIRTDSRKHKDRKGNEKTHISSDGILIIPKSDEQRKKVIRHKRAAHVKVIPILDMKSTKAYIK